MKLLVIGVLLFLIPQTGISSFSVTIKEQTFDKVGHLVILNDSDSLSVHDFIKMKATAVALAVTLGVFGVHRMYLGTSPRIPITYTLTLGGGFFILPAIDIVYILMAKTPDQLTDNNSIFMWNKIKKGNS